ncbi:transcriptional regulator TyrR [Thalassotalea sp. HSM 43]|uniref:transcriptional regulator TyrR n=1 Tax=Thalassotalea sp. HSM 43 TaxID=2552945 RepID=UPI0010822BFC|nr:transcriptional regulator TyrR [Thalassotalea sp. HSM 43]QBY05314.1 transcriptional regulator TyrR [Thalassotalea sp. HSM 43]
MRLEITCEDRVGIAQEVLAIFVDREINIKGIDAITESGQIFMHMPDLDFSQLQDFMPQLRLIDGVKDVKTTNYMPSERERIVLDTLVRTLPDPIISIDSRAAIYAINDVAQQKINCPLTEVVGQQLSNWIKGFNFNRYLEGEEVLPHTRRLKFMDEDFVADILPVSLPSENNIKVVAGAVVMLKSEARLGQQINAFNQPKDNDFSDVLVFSALMRKVVREARRMSLLDSSILLMGETGTGKELLARSCHLASERGEKPFVVVNCASMPDDACETELFGRLLSNGEVKKGIFELAEGGTIFLDEVAQMSGKLQSKLLRVLDDRRFRRIDDENEVEVDVRVISSTNADLLSMVETGQFREDLYYRLNVLGLNVPALRERRQDILPLADYFCKKACQTNHRTTVKIDDKCAEFMENYPWPGNVRQLENVILRAVSLLEGEVINIAHLQLPTYSQDSGYLEQEFDGTLEDAVKGFEAQLLRKLYPAYPSTRQLAKKLGLSHTAIANKLREYNINKKTVKI